MLNKLLGAATMAVVGFALVPASAASMHGCSGDNLAKTESTVESMADVPAKYAAQREIAQAQTAMLDGKMGACAMHLTNAMQAGTTAQAPYGGTMAQGPAETRYQAPSQPHRTRKPSKAAY